MWSKAFWLDTAERVVTSMAEAAVGCLIAFTCIQDANIPLTAGVAGLAGLVTLLKAIAARRVGDPDSAALLPLTTTRPSD